MLEDGFDLVQTKAYVSPVVEIC